jgi:hypothetical protein
VAAGVLGRTRWNGDAAPRHRPVDAGIAQGTLTRRARDVPNQGKRQGMRCEAPEAFESAVALLAAASGEARVLAGGTIPKGTS